jgi:hypothetical protein
MSLVVSTQKLTFVFSVFRPYTDLYTNVEETMKPADSTIRMPQDILERASKLDPENRSEILRQACLLGLEEMEKEKILASSGDVRRLVSEFLSRDEGLEMKVRGVVEKLLPSSARRMVTGKVSFLRLDEFEKGTGMAVFSLKSGESVELILPEMSWMVYRPIDLSIHSLDPFANVQVSRLCSDNGGGRDLLMPGWHRHHEFGGVATALAKKETIVSPNSLRMLIRSDRDTSVVVSMVVEVQRDDAFGGGGKTLESIDVSKSRKIRIPFMKMEAGPIGQGRIGIPVSRSHSTRAVNWGVLRVLGLVFEGNRERMFSTVFNDLTIGGSPCLTLHDTWNSAMEFTNLDYDLRANPVLISPNVSYVNLKSTTEEGEPLVPYLACEVLRDDAFQE